MPQVEEVFIETSGKAPRLNRREKGCPRYSYACSFGLTNPQVKSAVVQAEKIPENKND